MFGYSFFIWLNKIVTKYISIELGAWIVELLDRLLSFDNYINSGPES